MIKNNDPRYSLLRQIFIKARKTNGIRQSDLAKKLKVTQQFISKIETAERGIDILEFVELSRALGLNPSELIDQLHQAPVAEIKKKVA